MKSLFRMDNDESLLRGYVECVDQECYCRIEKQYGDLESGRRTASGMMLATICFLKNFTCLIFSNFSMANFSFMMKFVSTCTVSVLFLTLANNVIAKKDAFEKQKTGINTSSNSNMEVKDQLVSTAAMTYISSESGSSLAIIPEPSTLAYMFIASACVCMSCARRKNVKR